MTTITMIKSHIFKNSLGVNKYLNLVMLV